MIQSLGDLCIFINKLPIIICEAPKTSNLSDGFGNRPFPYHFDFTVISLDTLI